MDVIFKATKENIDYLPRLALNQGYISKTMQSNFQSDFKDSEIEVTLENGTRYILKDLIQTNYCITFKYSHKISSSTSFVYFAQNKIRRASNEKIILIKGYLIKSVCKECVFCKLFNNDLIICKKYKDEIKLKRFISWLLTFSIYSTLLCCALNFLIFKFNLLFFVLFLIPSLVSAVLKQEISDFIFEKILFRNEYSLLKSQLELAEINAQIESLKKEEEKMFLAEIGVDKSKKV